MIAPNLAILSINMILIQVVENCDCDLVPEGKFGALDQSGNYFGDFDTRSEAYRFITLITQDINEREAK